MCQFLLNEVHFLAISYSVDSLTRFRSSVRKLVNLHFSRNTGKNCPQYSKSPQFTAKRSICKLMDRCFVPYQLDWEIERFKNNSSSIVYLALTE